MLIGWSQSISADSAMHRVRIVGFTNFICLKKDAAIASETFVLLIKMTQWKV